MTNPPGHVLLMLIDTNEVTDSILLFDHSDTINEHSSSEDVNDSFTSLSSFPNCHVTSFSQQKKISDVWEKRRQERMRKNRESAQASRERKKNQIGKLERDNNHFVLVVSQLNARVKSLEQANESLRTELYNLKLQIQKLNDILINSPQIFTFPIPFFEENLEREKEKNQRKESNGNSIEKESRPLDLPDKSSIKQPTRH